jgi:glycosyltransferase involved in cell wall biosynthesis
VHGGEGVQQTLLAREFRRRGYEVHMLALDYGQPDGEVLHGIHIWKTYEAKAGFPVLRFLYPRASSILKALKNANADVYYQSCAGVLTGLTAWFCHRDGRPFIYRVASDTDCIPGQQLIRYSRDRKLYEYGLRHADLIISQSEQQAELLRQNYNLKSEVAGMPVQCCENIRRFEGRDLDILWVNNIRPIKMPDRVLLLAGDLLNHSFCVIGGASHGSEQLFESLRKKSDRLTNLDWKGFVPYHEARKHFERARIFLSTSDSEGFPNTYLQAWMAGTPVVVFFDPDGVVAREGLGKVVSSVEEARRTVTKLLGNPEEWSRISARARAYALRHHGRGVVDRYEQLVGQVLNSQGAANE